MAPKRRMGLDHDSQFINDRGTRRSDVSSFGVCRAFDWYEGARFHTAGDAGGNVFTFNLADALKKGPVVLYFYPAAFTPGCTIEAHEFADAIDQYRALGATVIGVSHDPLDKLQKFSVSECRSKFAVAADTSGTVMKAYDSVLAQHPHTRTEPPTSSHRTERSSIRTRASIPRCTSKTR